MQSWLKNGGICCWIMDKILLFLSVAAWFLSLFHFFFCEEFHATKRAPFCVIPPYTKFHSAFRKMFKSPSLSTLHLADAISRALAVRRTQPVLQHYTSCDPGRLSRQSGKWEIWEEATPCNVHRERGDKSTTKLIVFPRHLGPSACV